jgi:transcriptional regulator with XRE-family HTH domain
MLDISPTHIKHIESGHRKPSIEILFEIARVLNLSLDGVVFPKDITQSDLTRGKIDRLLDSLDEDSLQFVLTVLEALHVKEQADG